MTVLSAVILLPALLLATVPAVAQEAAPATPPGVESALTLNARILAELRAQDANRAAQTAQYKAAVTVQNQQTIEIQRDADESEAAYTARVAAWRANTAQACTLGNAEACAKIGK